MTTRLDAELDALAEELARLNKETGDLTRNYSIEAAYAMQSGKPRAGAAANERMAREKFARMKEIEAIINTHHGN
ncbi:MAG: hypothetical protein A2948_05695 [Candidatus Lloydbacteria bacterium RIFCSPLOWO2_01_FULL_54_18]|nr:MAG: hypothetical protein A2948_05695 [Candidatus Lloydbacteria bacterium RIFCSPLOWO2_01_FULL_54_18]